MAVRVVVAAPSGDDQSASRCATGEETKPRTVARPARNLPIEVASDVDGVLVAPRFAGWAKPGDATPSSRGLDRTRNFCRKRAQEAQKKTAHPNNSDPSLPLKFQRVPFSRSFRSRFVLGSSPVKSDLNDLFEQEEYRGRSETDLPIRVPNVI
jgi:hypothetical protein